MNWFAVASSSDGNTLVAVPNGGNIYVSTNGGANWIARGISQGYYNVACSADGTKQVAVVYGGGIYISTDSGTSWAVRSSAGTRDWYQVASSGDGTRLVATVVGGYIYTSTDSGVTWTQETGAGSRNWSALVTSSGGLRIIAGVNSGFFYVANTASTFFLTSGTSTVKVATTLNGAPYYSETVPIPYELSITLKTEATKFFPISKTIVDWLVAHPSAKITGAGTGIKEDFRGQTSKVAFVEFDSSAYFHTPVNVYEFLTGTTYIDSDPPTGVQAVLM
jgi:hypothetical protein